MAIKPSPARTDELIGARSARSGFRMPKLMVCQHVAFEILGTLNPLLKKSGFRIRYVNFERSPHAQPRIDSYHGLVLLGGPMSVRDVEEYPHLESELRLVQDALDKGVPILGICLGAQLVAKALGAAVEPNAEKEIGWYDVRPTRAGHTDPLLAPFGDGAKLFQWHGDSFEIPTGAVHLASSETCRNQAFRYGDNVYGFQFHLECDERLIERWLTVPVHQEELWRSNGRFDPVRIRKETARHVGNLKRLSREVFGCFAALFDPDTARTRRSAA